MAYLKAWCVGLLLVSAGCSSVSHPPIALVPKVDLPRFMGDWFVIANIPTAIEKGAHNAVESYRLAEDGSIPTTFTFRADGFDGFFSMEPHLSSAHHLGGFSGPENFTRATEAFTALLDAEQISYR